MEKSPQPHGRHRLHMKVGLAGLVLALGLLALTSAFPRGDQAGPEHPDPGADVEGVLLEGPSLPDTVVVGEGAAASATVVARGLVMDPHGGRAGAGVVVTARVGRTPKDSFLHGATSEDGSFVLACRAEDLPTEDATLFFTAESSDALLRSPTHAIRGSDLGADLWFILCLAEPRPFSVQVTDPAGQPVAGGEIVFQGLASMNGRPWAVLDTWQITDLLGRCGRRTANRVGLCRLLLPEGDFLLYARSPDGVFGPPAQVAVGPGGAKGAVVTTCGDRTVSINLRIRDDRGRPVAGALVRTEFPDGFIRAARLGHAGEVRLYRSDEAGNVRGERPQVGRRIRGIRRLGHHERERLRRTPPCARTVSSPCGDGARPTGIGDPGGANLPRRTEVLPGIPDSVKAPLALTKSAGDLEVD